MPAVGPALRSTLTPIVQAMRALPEQDRAAWLHDLGADAPHVAAAIEQLLNERPSSNTAGVRRTLRGLLVSAGLVRP